MLVHTALANVNKILLLMNQSVSKQYWHTL